MEKLNPVQPGVKSAETAELWFTCVGLNVTGRSPKTGSAVAAQILRFAQRNRQLNVRGARIPPLSLLWREKEDPTPARLVGPLSVCLAISRSTDRGRQRVWEHAPTPA